MNFELRPMRASDLENLIRYADNPNIAKYVSDSFPSPYTREAGERFIDMATNPKDHSKVWAIAIDDQLVGGIGLHAQAAIYRKNLMIGYWLAEPFWGKGIVTAAAEQVLDYWYKEMPDIYRVYGSVFTYNPASRMVLEKVGMRLEATILKSVCKYEELHDEWILAITRPEWEARTQA